MNLPGVMASLKHYCIHLVQLPPTRWPGKIMRFGLRQIRELTEETLTRFRVINRIPRRLDSALVESLRGKQVPQLLKETLPKRFLISPEQRETIVTALREVAPEAEKLIIAEADRICDHIFHLLGSGPTPLGKKIDWHVDFKTGHRWNPKTYYKRIRPAPYPGGYDIKVPWELSRCQHFVRLGQAYWITGDEKYAREFVAQVEDWIESNPWLFGVNWACTMDVAIRAVNWLWGLAFFLDSPSMTDKFLLRLTRSLLVHGRHIMGNLEGSREDNHTTNHYIADLVGLIYLGICCPFLKEAKRWLGFATDELWNEVFKQVYPDGVDYEGSVPYHRLVTEMFLSAILLCRRNGIEVPQTILERLEKMIEFIYYVTKPDGTVPIIGDQDNGRLHRLAVWVEPEREWGDYRYLLAIGAVFFQRGDFAQIAGDQWEEAIWLFGEKTVVFKRAIEAKKSPRLRLESRAFPDAGLYVMRHDDLYLIVDAGLNGEDRNGGHGHNDTLSFELYIHDKAFVIDPGTYVYTADYRWRNKFRSTEHHNTIVIDGEEMNDFRRNSLFSMKNHAIPTVYEWISTDGYDFFDGEHSSYHRLLHPVTHRRQVFFDKPGGFWLIRDILTGKGEHQLDLYFHLAPMEIASNNDDLSVKSLCQNGANLVIIPLKKEGLSLAISEDWVSYSYGRKTRAPVVKYTKRAQVPTDFVTLLYPCINEDLSLDARSLIEALTTEPEGIWQDILGDWKPLTSMGNSDDLQSAR